MPGRSLRRSLTLLAAATGVYLCFLGALVAWHRAVIYPFDPAPFYDATYDRMPLRASDGEALSLVAWTGGDPRAPVILFFMGNGGSLDVDGDHVAEHRAAGRSVVALEYRGGGGRPGRPSETLLKADALAAYDALGSVVGPVPVIVHGFSMGSGMALHVASRRKVAGVILDAPLARFCDILARALWVPACQTPFVQKWDNLAHAGQIAAPVLILHGDADDRVPHGDGRRLAGALSAAGAAVDFVTLPGATHGDLVGRPDRAAKIAAFIAAAATGG